MERKVDFLASERHFVDHLLPVYLKVPEDIRGELITGSQEINPGRLTVVSSVGDYRKTTGPVVYMEHGVGFSFGGDAASYAGSTERERVVLFMNVNEQTAALNRATFPRTKSVLIGCPKLDVWLARGKKERNGRAKVAHSFHWECRVVPETRSAFSHYKDEIAKMAVRKSKLQWDMLGHGHPRLWNTIGRFWRHLNVPLVREFNDVVTLADVYVADATSTIYEFAALDRPVVVLNAPWYRRNVNHGLRFWDHVPGIQVDHPKDLTAAIKDAVFKDSFARERRAAVEVAYPIRGNSSELAAKAIAELF